MVKIITVIGARPQFIKAAAVSKALEDAGGIREVIVHTGQHFDNNMSKVFFDQMGIPRPKYNLGIHSLAHGAMTGAMLKSIEEVLVKERPDWVMVYGDTNSTLAGALAAVKLGIPVAHVEAGLRSYNISMPEEINRIITDRISTLLFCPTLGAIQNLIREGFESFPAKMLLTGDVMYDAMLYFQDKATPPEGISLPGQYALATVHRAENTDDPGRLGSIVASLNAISDDLPVVFPVHPRTAKLLESSGVPPLGNHVHIMQAVGYLEMLYLLNHCELVVTDSGGLQKEAYFFKKPCITVRNETEWTELVDAGYNRLCGGDIETILEAYRHYRSHKPSFNEGLYGNGNAAIHIAGAFLL